MAEKKTHTYTSASTGKTSSTKPVGAAAALASGNAGGLRVGAVILWILAIAFEVLAVMLILEKLLVLPKIDPLYKGIGALVLDFACVVAGSQLWKKANHISPASQKNPVKFWLWNNMGVLVAAVAFIPFVIILLTNKETDKKTKVIGSVAAVVLLAISGLVSYDWNPLSAEAVAKAAAQETVYWTEHGKKFHLYDTCQALDRTENLNTGTAQEAIDSGRGTICKFCEKRFEKEQPEAFETIQQAAEELPAAANE